MAERRFTRGLGKPGMAAQLRENVSQAVKATALQQAQSRLFEPLDFEEYITKNKIMLHNDPVKEVLYVPQHAVQYSTIPRELATLHCLASVVQSGEVHGTLVRQSLHTYTTPQSVVTYRDVCYSGSYLQLPRLPKIEDLKEQVYEVDTDIEQGDLTLLTNGDNILKKGYLLKGPDATNEKLFSNFSSKTFKRRFACLRQEVDGTYLLEFHKDERKHDPKGTIVLDFCTAVNKNPVRGACWFELQFSAAGGGGVSVLSAESEADMQDWTDKLMRVLHADKPAVADDADRNRNRGTSEHGTLRSLQHSLSPHLAKMAHETCSSRYQARLAARTSMFVCCPDTKQRGDDISSLCLDYTDDPDYSDVGESPTSCLPSSGGVRVRVTCESLRFRLQAPIDGGDGPLSQLEPYMTRLALYDLSIGRKISEDFHFHLNSPMARSLLLQGGPASGVRGSKGGGVEGQEGSDCPVPVPLNLAGVPEEWLAYPKQCVCSVSRPSPDVFLVVVVQKVLQGGVTAASEPYTRYHHDLKTTARLQKTVKTCCQRLGEHRMPFAWCARQLFTPFGHLDPNTDMSPLYRCDERRGGCGEGEVVKLLTELKKTDKMGKLTVILGSVSVKLSLIDVNAPNSLTPSLEPLTPFPNPPTHEPTLRLQEFSTDSPEKAQPFAAYVNNLYVYPRHLNYENQKIFGRARNLLCTVELRDSDADGAAPLRVVYSRPCQSGGGTAPHQPPSTSCTLTTTASTTVLHHNTFPEWGDEIKVALPHNLTPSYHLLFTFSHIAIEGAKAGKKEDYVEVVGYAWCPLLFKGRVNTEDQILPVAAHLPARYLSIEPFGLGKGFAGPEVRWVDSQRNVFRLSTRLVSSVLTADIHLHNFFQATSGLLTHPQTPTTATPSGNPFASAFNGALSVSSNGPASLDGGSDGGLPGAYRSRTESGSNASNSASLTSSSIDSPNKTNYSIGSNAAFGGNPPSVDTLSAISGISPAISMARSPAVSTPKSSRSSSVSTLVGSAGSSGKTGPSEAEIVRCIKIRSFQRSQTSKIGCLYTFSCAKQHKTL